MITRRPLIDNRGSVHYRSISKMALRPWFIFLIIDIIRFSNVTRIIRSVVIIAQCHQLTRFGLGHLFSIPIEN